MKKFLFYFCLWAISFMTGCKDSSEGIDEPVYNFSVTPASINVDAQGGKQSISVSTTSDWDIKCDAGWVHIDSHSGTGNKTVSIDIEANKSTEKRNTTLAVKEYKKGETQTVSISQDGMAYSLSVDPESLSFANTETKGKTINVMSNDDWTVECSDSWIKTDKKEGSGNDSFSVSLTGENNDTSVRQGSITVKGKNSKSTATIKIEQSAASFYIDVDPTKWNLTSSDTDSKVFKVSTNDSWTAQSNNDWISIKRGSESGTGDGNFTVEVEENYEINSRSGTITLEGKNSDKINIEIKQPEKVYHLNVNHDSFAVDANGGEKAVDVSSNDSWTVSTSDSWLSTSKTSGSNDGSFTIAISANTTTSERTGFIYIIGSKSSIKKTIDVTQSGKTSQPTGPTYVDLGLPSGKKWATCNLGANSPEQNGSKYTWYEAVGNNYSTYTDKAFNEWGGNWRVPAYNDVKELMENCTWAKVTTNGVSGFQGKSKINGNTVFFPYSDSAIDGYKHGTYWTSSIYDSSKNEVSDYNNFETVGILYFDERNQEPERMKNKPKDYLYYSNCIRPVYIK